jgi:phasin family protein
VTDQQAAPAKATRSRKSKAGDAATRQTAIVAERAAPEEPATEPLTPQSAPLAETLEAASSPAVRSDAMPAPAEAAAAASEDWTDMALPNETAEKAQALLGDFSDRFKTAFEKSSKLGEDMVDFAKGNVEAVIASARVAAKAGETLGQEAADYGKKNFETASAAFKSFATVKSPTELFQLQSEFAKAQFDSAVAEASKVSETLLKLAGDIAQPLSNRYALAAEKFKANTL